MSEIKHARIKLPVADVHPNHPFKNPNNHTLLLDYIRDRLLAEKSTRDPQVERMCQIDRDTAGWIQHDQEDRDRQREHRKTGAPQAVKMNLPLTYIHLDDMMTYYAQTFAPNRGMFFHSAGPTEAAASNQIVALMNNHAIYSSGYRQLLLAIYALLKYNSGGVEVNWGTDYGPQIAPDPDDPAKISVTDVPIWSGNRMEAIDMYNFMYDRLVDPTKLYKDGEWAAKAEIKSHFWLQRAAAASMYFNVQDILDDGVEGGRTCEFYKHPPKESRMGEQTGSGGLINWVDIMSHGSVYSDSMGFEIVTCYIRLNPTEFGLIPGSKADIEKRSRLEIWRISICNGSRIIDATHMSNVHNYLPFFLGVVNDDSMGPASKAVSETIQPLSDFSSFLLNAHVQGTRKNLYGTTFYDPSVVDYADVPEGEVAARVPMKAPGFGKDVRNFIYHDNKLVDTKQTLQDLQAMLGIIDQFFPAQSMPSQVAGIDRAIGSQVAAVQQGANRRQHKTGRLLDDTMMRPMRFGMYYNIIQYQKDGVSVSDFYGKPVEINLEELRQTDLPFIIGQGLKSIDRQASAAELKDLIFALIQNPDAAAQTDIMGLFNYWATLLDIDVDLTQFRRQQPVAPANQGVPGDESIKAPEAPPAETPA